nr:basic 7S globulin-like [Tanacetum cinerariifolium]
YKNNYCHQVPNNKPGWGFCECPINVVNPITGSCDEALLNSENLFITTSNGRNPYDGFSALTLNAACLPSSSFESFPTNVSGVMAMSTSHYALPEFLYQAETLMNRAIAFCLPSTTSAAGVLFYGNGPYYFTSHPDVDIRSFLSYTPLRKHPDSFGYFIGVIAIVIKQRSIVVPRNATTKLSTIQPYTTLRTDIYNSVIASGIRAKGIKQHNNSCFNHQESAMDAEFEDEKKKKRKEVADSEQKEKKEEADMATLFCIIYAKTEDPHEDIGKLDGDKAMINWNDNQEMIKHTQQTNTSHEDLSGDGGTNPAGIWFN